MDIIHIYYCLISFLVIALAYWYGHRTKEWKWSEYFLMALAPIIGVGFLAWFEGEKIIIYFILSSLAGTMGEFLLGFFCDKILGKKMWKYSKWDIFGYTSILMIPFWGGAGIVFLTLAKLLKF